MTKAESVLETTVCVAGGGPAGMMLGYLLARAGIDVVVLEKHDDFLRDFRGDTVHPSTLQVMRELGLLEEFLAEPHDKVTEMYGRIGHEHVMIADFSHLKTGCPFIALMPQWNFLNFLASHARRYRTFRLMLGTAVTDLVTEGDTVVGARLRNKSGEQSIIKAKLVVGADGRRSTVRQAAGLQAEELGVPIDVLWMRIPRRENDPKNPMGIFQRGHVVVLLDRTTYWQMAFIIPKGGFEQIKSDGLAAFQHGLTKAVPFLADRVGEIDDFAKVSLLTVQVDRLLKWHKPGVLCIGDAAHAMSPIGGVGINLAIQDAVATANELAETFVQGKSPTTQQLQDLQDRRIFPTRITQQAQILIQNKIIFPTLDALSAKGELTVPFPIKLFQVFPSLRRIPAYLVGVGVRPEHVRTPDAFAAP